MSKRTTASRTLAAISAGLFLAVGVTALITNPAFAAGGSAGSWGPNGSSATDSAVTVRWDNAENSTDNTVLREETTPLPHTVDKTYADLDPTIRQAYADALGNVAVTVSQTAELRNQTIQVAISGVSAAAASTAYFEVFQCWGAPLYDEAGTYLGPDPDAAGPDPETCQVGQGSNFEASRTYVVAAADSGLVAGGDWGTSNREIPFLAIDGTSVEGRTANNPYFSTQSTNEITGPRAEALPVGADGSGLRPFEIQTSVEAQGLGCGAQADSATSTSSCWLVIVPQGTDVVLAPVGNNGGPLTPTAWANRLQVKLEMANVTGFCPGDKARVLTAGSELARGAMASWIPAMCDQLDIGIGYTVLGDQQVRTTFQSGSRSELVVSSPASAVEDSVYSPIALGGTVIGFVADKGGAPFPQLRLTPRLVAKLLTQSYMDAIDLPVTGNQLEARAPWVASSAFGARLIVDQEFRALNPQLGSLPGTTGASDIIATITDSDSARAVWEWIVADPGALAFLSGCPDPYGKVVNPFFSTRTYVGCEGDADALETRTQQWIEQTDTPENYFYNDPVYPPDTTVFPQPGWYQRDETTVGGELWGVLTLGDLHPRLTNLGDTGRTVARAIYPQNLKWCPVRDDSTCTPLSADGPQGMWKSSATPQIYGSRTVLAITDTATAARFQVQTALLCASSDTTGATCVGADQDSLTAAAERFQPTEIDGVLKGGEPDYAAGAYPMTLPIYMGFNIATLPRGDAETFADVLGFVTGEGQTPGYRSGQLPPGYAPLPETMLEQVDVAIDALRTGIVPETPQQPQNPQNPQQPTTVLPPSTFVPRQNQPPAAPAPTPTGPADPEVVAAVGTTPLTEIGFPQFGLAGGLLAAVVTGIASPIVGGGRRLRR